MSSSGDRLREAVSRLKHTAETTLRSLPITTAPTDPTADRLVAQFAEFDAKLRRQDELLRLIAQAVSEGREREPLPAEEVARSAHAAVEPPAPRRRRGVVFILLVLIFATFAGGVAAGALWRAPLLVWVEQARGAVMTSWQTWIAG